MAVLFLKREFTMLKRHLLKTLKNSKKKAMISEVCCKNITIEEKLLWGTNGNLWFRVNGLTFDCNIAIISCVTIVNKFVTIETAQKQGASHKKLLNFTGRMAGEAE